MAEIARITIAFAEVSEGFDNIQDSAEQAVDTVKKSTKEAVSSYEMLIKKQSEYNELVKEGERIYATFAKNSVEETKK